ncbi:MAG: NADH-quinone oxidoreductase subunit N [Dehalococcoidia bacterium]|nr:NADH-quinone oxidoreductase subunit N [Dehalococcoidia bacterium]
MTARDLYLLSPEIALAGVAILVVILDLLVRSKRVVGAVAFLGLAVPIALTVVLWTSIDSETAVFGTLAVDKFALFFKILVLAIVGVLILGSADYVARFQRYQGEFYALVLFSATGMMLLAATTELISIYISLELTALPLAALAAFLRDERSTEAGIKFLLLSAMSSALLLYGMVLVYGFTGSTQLQEIAGAVAQGDMPFGSYALLAGVTLMVVGFGFKIAMVPFQMWVPDVYEGAPTPITTYLSVASKAAGFAVLLRIFYFALPAVSGDWGTLFAVLSALSMTVGNLVAIAQNNIKRMLAYSTIAHAGYILVGVAAFAARSPGPDGVALGPSGVLFYLAAYAATNLAAFFAIMAIASRTGSEQIDDFAGIARRAPWVAAVLAFAMLSLIGIPPTAGFMGKLYLFNAAVRGDLVWLAVVGVISSVVSAYYYLRVVRVLYLGAAPSEEAIPSSWPVRLALALTGGSILAIGLLPGRLLELGEAAVRIFSLTPQ